MKPDELEQKLQRQPLRQIPAAWRDEILSAAQSASAFRHPSRVTRHSAWWRELFWPAPQAWAALAAAWLVILAADFATRDATPMLAARHAVPPSPEIRELLKQQYQLLAELVGPAEKPEADRPKATPPPRSQRREGFLTA